MRSTGMVRIFLLLLGFSAGVLFALAWKLGVNFKSVSKVGHNLLKEASDRTSSHRTDGLITDHSSSSALYTLNKTRLAQVVKNLQLNLEDAWVSETLSLFPKEHFEDLDIPQFKARIPALVYYKKTLLVFSEARFDTVKDFGNMMISLRRGRLTGRKVTWERIRLIAGIRGFRTMNPTPIVDQKNNAIVVVFAAFPTNMLFDDLMKHRGEKLSRVYVMKSYNVGLTWTDPAQITDQTISKIKPFPILFAPGPGHSIQLKSGRLIIPGNFFTTKRNEGIFDMCSNCTNLVVLMYSDDGGTTWHLGAKTSPAFDAMGTQIYPNEAQLAELEDGTLYMNLRTLDAMQPRAYCYSYDGGQSLTPLQLHPALVEPGYRKRNSVWERSPAGGCHASVIAVNFGSPSQLPTSERNWLVFSNPADPLERANLGIRLSMDRGVSWSDPWIIFHHYAGYSDLVSIKTTVAGKPEQYFAILFEGGIVKVVDHVKFQMFNLEALIKNALEHQRSKNLY